MVLAIIADSLLFDVWKMRSPVCSAWGLWFTFAQAVAQRAAKRHNEPTVSVWVHGRLGGLKVAGDGAEAMAGSLRAGGFQLGRVTGAKDLSAPTLRGYGGHDDSSCDGRFTTSRAGRFSFWGRRATIVIACNPRCDPLYIRADHKEPIPWDSQGA